MLIGDKNIVHSFLTKAAEEVVSKMFDLSITPIKEDILFAYEVIVAIDFEGKYKGKLWIILPKKLSYFLSEKFLKMPADQLDDEIVQDTSKEIVNMICGNITYLVDKENSSTLSIPNIYVDTSAHDQIIRIPATALYFSFKIDEFPLKIVINIES